MRCRSPLFAFARFCSFVTSQAVPSREKGGERLSGLPLLAAWPLAGCRWLTRRDVCLHLVPIEQETTVLFTIGCWSVATQGRVRKKAYLQVSVAFDMFYV